MENGSEMQLLTGAQLAVNQSFAMILKKYYYNVRNIKVLVIQNLIPVVFLILTVSFFYIKVTLALISGD